MKRDNTQSARDLIVKLDLQCAETTVRARVREDGETRSYFRRKKPYISEKNQKKRVEWCKAHEHWSEQDWERVLWTDESPFGLRFKGAERVYCKSSERLLPKNLQGTVKHQKKVMVWGGFCASGVGTF